jgi:hypothetical protein
MKNNEEFELKKALKQSGVKLTKATIGHQKRQSDQIDKTVENAMNKAN